MADRTQKKIQNITGGDRILSFNKGKYRAKRVAQLKLGQAKDVHGIIVRLPGGAEASIRATAGHPFYVKGGGWSTIGGTFKRPVRKLEAGDQLVLRSGGLAEVVRFDAPSGRRQNTFNLIVDGPGAFFVNEVLTHSGLPPPAEA